MNFPDVEDWIRVDTTPKGCQACHEERDARVEMERDHEWAPAFAAHVPVWRCPACDRTVVREAELVNP